MRPYLLILPIIVFGSGSYGNASTGSVEEEKSTRILDIRYGDPVGERYRTLTILSDGKVVRTLGGGNERGGAFERTDPPLVSPNGHFVFLTQVESGEAGTPDGSVMHHEVAYCELVDVRSGCIVARETGEFCGGTFTRGGLWDNPIYPNFNLVTEIPGAEDYLEGRLKFTDSPISSVENLLVCDPPDADNADVYRTILNSKLLKFDSAQRELLERKMKSH